LRQPDPDPEYIAEPEARSQDSPRSDPEIRLIRKIPSTTCLLDADERAQNSK
jgi:hypothetical protein